MLKLIAISKSNTIVDSCNCHYYDECYSNFDKHWQETSAQFICPRYRYLCPHAFNMSTKPRIKPVNMYLRYHSPCIAYMVTIFILADTVILVRASGWISPKFLYYRWKNTSLARDGMMFFYWNYGSLIN